MDDIQVDNIINFIQDIPFHDICNVLVYVCVYITHGDDGGICGCDRLKLSVCLGVKKSRERHAKEFDSCFLVLSVCIIRKSTKNFPHKECDEWIWQLYYALGVGFKVILGEEKRRWQWEISNIFE